MKKYIVPLVQFAIIVSITLLLHYIFFVLIGRYEQDSSTSSVLHTHELYIYILQASLIFGLVYGQMYQEWKRIIWRTLAIVHGNMLTYYYLIETLGISENSAEILVLGSIIGGFIAYSSIKQKFQLLTIDIVIVIVCVILESIPVYTKKVSLEILLSQQSNHLYTFQETESREVIQVHTEQGKNSYTLNSLANQPLSIRNSLQSISYNSSNPDASPILLRTRNGLFVTIYPQSQLTIDEQKNLSDPLTSQTTFDVVAGSVNIIPLSDRISFSHLIKGVEQDITTGSISLTGVTQYVDSYIAELTNQARSLFAWEYTDSWFLEDVILYKMLLYQFINYEVYTPYIENFYAYRYLVYGIKPPFESDILALPIKERIDTETSQREEVDPVEQLNKGLEKSWGQTRVLQDWFP